ncbi:hypothetical protein CCR75_009166 [Bremia lactucae]|uniref:Uncharacterized protein n=1 Tax=Bremia lactucae TaxID=4779 RepID=A0A976IG92_BRELC|nr:hypothetical protein CCR75_009166 [Bremia lactucae]
MIGSRFLALLMVSMFGVSSSTLSLSDCIHAFNASELFTLQPEGDPSLVWFEYERFLLSPDRTTPLLLFFISSSICSGGEVFEENFNDEKLFLVDQEVCLRHQMLVEAAMTLAAETVSTPQLPFIRIDVQTWPEMLQYHMLPATPSLLWVPGRTSEHFQRYPYLESNFLDLSAAEDIISKQDKENKNIYDSLSHDAASKTVAQKITKFVHLCQERSGYLAHGRLSPKLSVDSHIIAISALELLPILAFAAFIAFAVHENRAFALEVVQMRHFWFLVCIVIIYVALSGLCHSIIHRQAWYYFGPLHGFVFVHPSSRRQFVLEGLVNGSWSFWLSLGLMGVSDVAPAIKSRLAKEEVFRWSLLLVIISYMALHFSFLMKYRSLI